MKLKFNGLEIKTKTGCVPCGKAKGSTSLQTTKTFFLPSGRTVTFRQGRAEEVSAEDGAFLLDYNGTRKVFEEV